MSSRGPADGGSRACEQASKVNPIAACYINILARRSASGPHADLHLSGIGSAAAWLRRYLNRDERDANTSHRNRILTVVSEVREARSEEDLLTSQREVDAIIAETLKCYDDGTVEQEDLAAFALVLELFDHAVAQRRAALQSGLPDQARTQGPTIASLR